MIVLCLAGLAALAAPPAAALAPPAASAATAVDPATLAAARRMLAATDIRGLMHAIGPQIVDAAIASARASFKDSALPPGLLARLQEVMHQQLPTLTDVYTPDVIDQMAGVYARHFTAAELNRLADMMADPVMVRFRAETPAVTRDMIPIILAAMAPRQKAFQQSIMRAVADWVRDHPQDKARLARPLAS